MTPSNNLGMSPNAASVGGSSPSQLFNSISSAGQPPTENANTGQQPNQESPVEKLLARYSETYNKFKELTSVEDYAVAPDEAAEVKKAMNNWLAAVSNKLPSSAPNRGESSGNANPGSNSPY